MLLRENSACTAALTGSVVAHIKASSKASSLPRHHLKWCLAITRQEWSRIVQEEGSSGKRRAPWYVRTVSLIEQPGFCYCFPLSRQGNFHAVAAFRRSHLRQMVWVTLELRLSSDHLEQRLPAEFGHLSKVEGRRETMGEEQRVRTCSVQSTHGKRLNCVFISAVNCESSSHGRRRKGKKSFL